jgi:hypothetical protein
MDDNPGLVEPFLKEQKLTFPVLPACSYVRDTLRVFGIPQNWVVDATGTVRLKGIGYDASEKWEQGMVDAVDKNKPEAAPAPTGQAPGQ